MEFSNQTIAEIVKKIDERTEVETVIEMVGSVDTATYLALRSNWKADYVRLSQEIRETKAKMKDKDEGSRYQWPREMLRGKARRMMILRSAIRNMGRRHWEAKRAELAA